MSERYKVGDSERPSFITITVIDWVDLFIRPDYFKLLDDSLNYCINEKGLVVNAYVYMTSHIHLIASSSQEPLETIIRDFKRHTSKEIIRLIKEIPESRREWLLNKFSYAADRIKRNDKYKVWKDGFHPVLLDTNRKLEQRVNYLHRNPVEEHYVFHERDYVNSSYRAYEGAETRVKVVPLF